MFRVRKQWKLGLENVSTALIKCWATEICTDKEKKHLTFKFWLPVLLFLFIHPMSSLLMSFTISRAYVSVPTLLLFEALVHPVAPLMMIDLNLEQGKRPPCSAPGVTAACLKRNERCHSQIKDVLSWCFLGGGSLYVSQTPAVWS